MSQHKDVLPECAKAFGEIKAGLKAFDSSLAIHMKSIKESLARLEGGAEKLELRVRVLETKNGFQKGGIAILCLLLGFQAPNITQVLKTLFMGTGTP